MFNKIIIGIIAALLVMFMGMCGWCCICHLN